MSWCNDPYEPECEGPTCKKWGACQFSKDCIRENPDDYEPIGKDMKDGCACRAKD